MFPELFLLQVYTGACVCGCEGVYVLLLSFVRAPLCLVKKRVRNLTGDALFKR